MESMMIEKLKKAIAEAESFDSAVIISPENRFYFSGFQSSDGYLVVTADRAVFITDGRYVEAAQNTVTGCEVVLQERSRAQLYNILNEQGCKAAAVESTRMTLSEFSSLSNALNEIEVVADGSLDRSIHEIRSVKEPFEVQKIITAQRIAEKAFEHICGFIREGVTEKEVAIELDYFMLKNGAEALSFETIAVSGKKSSMPHGVPGQKAIENGEFVTMDFGAVFEGYHSDMTRTVAVGFASDEMKTVYATVLKAQQNALGFIQNGVSCKSADEAARIVIENAGYGDYFTHSTGHGVGVEIHEAPNLSPVSEKTLHTGNIITVEPGIYIPGKFGVRIEDMAFVTEDGCKNLTSCPKELIIV